MDTQTQPSTMERAPAAERRRDPDHGFLPYVTSEGRISLAPIVKWADLGTALKPENEAARLRELSGKAAVLRLVAADFVAQAQELEREIARSKAS